MVSVVAFYLPQFHPIPENDLWWGNGFTEWTNTRKAKPLFPGHYQPREPDQSRYYSLLDPDVREWQTSLARRYGVDGFCYYHYWFNGKQLLEKPFNAVLESGRPDFPFCLSWANEPWTRTWTGRHREVLMLQDYGSQSDWTRHFEYLSKAFDDKRYLRVEGKPLFVIYRPSHIPRRNEMLAFWRRCAKEHGWEGLHLMHVLNTFEPRPVKGFDGVIELEPMYTISHGMPILWRARRYATALARFATRNSPKFHSRFLDLVDYDLVWSRIRTRNLHRWRLETCPGAFVDWDNSPRRGRNGTIVRGGSPTKFEENLRGQIARASENRSGFVFINAWNEWAESAYLEPDVGYGAGYLEALSRCRNSSPETRPDNSRT